MGLQNDVFEAGSTSTSSGAPAIELAPNPPIALPLSSAEKGGPAKGLSKAERIMALWAGITALGTLVSAVAICLQWYELHTGGKDTSRIADAAHQQVCAADRFAASAESINTGVQLAVSKLNAQSEAMSRLAKATEAANRNAIQVERPWVGLSDYTVVHFQEGKTPNITLVFTNSGRRPALVHVDTVLGPGTEEQEVVSFGPTQGETLVLPNTPANSRPNFDAPLPAGYFERMRRDGQSFFIYGRISYTDVRTKRSYYTHFCLVRPSDPAPNSWPPHGGFHRCAKYQDAD